MKINKEAPSSLLTHLVKGSNRRGAPQSGGHVGAGESLGKQFRGRWGAEERKGDNEAQS